MLRALIGSRAQRIVDIVGAHAADRDELVMHVVRFSEEFGKDPVLTRLLTHEPQVFTQYAFQRIGRSQRILLEWLAPAIATAQRGGSVREGDPADLAVMVLLLTQSVVLSGGAVSSVIAGSTLRAELTHALDAYLRPNSQARSSS